MTFNGNFMPKRFGAGKPQKPKESRSHKRAAEKMERAIKSANDKTAWQGFTR